MIRSPRLILLSHLTSHSRRTAFPLDFYTDPSPDQLAPYLESHSTFLHRARYSSLNEKILEIIDDFSLVSFETLAVEDKESMWRLVRLVDKVGGWVFVHAGEMGLGRTSSADDDEDDDEEEEQMPSQMRAALEGQYLDGNKVSSSSATRTRPPGEPCSSSPSPPLHPTPLPRSHPAQPPLLSPSSPPSIRERPSAGDQRKTCRSGTSTPSRTRQQVQDLQVRLV